MKPPPPNAADGVYNALASHTLTRHSLYHAGFKDFYLTLSRLRRELGELAEENDWKWILRKFNRYRFSAAAAPIAFNHPSIQAAPLDQIRSKINWCAELYPTFANTSKSLLSIYETLQALSDNPIRDWLSREILPGTSVTTGVVLRDSDFIEATEEVLRSIALGSQVQVLTPQQLRDTHCYGRLVVIGPAYWYSENKEYLFRAPRAPRIDLLQYQWIRDSWTLKPAFDGSVFTASSPIEMANIPPQALTPSAEMISAEESVPAIDWGQYASSAEKTDRNDPAQDIVTARLFMLEGGSVVYLDESEGAKSLIIDLEAVGKDKVRRLPVMNIVEGMFILIRTGGGGDLIVPIADKVLGRRAIESRIMQADWKNRLLKIVKTKSPIEASMGLIDCGAAIANEMNLRNWISARNIKTQDQDTFMAIMKYIGFSPNIGLDYWNAMSAIDGAHRRAGTIIRHRLIREVLGSDPIELIRKGIKSFELKKEGGGSITAYRIKAKAPETAIVPASLILHPLDAEDR